jgi:hypothetical protein
MISVATALCVLNDSEGFFPDEWKSEAVKVIEEKGTEEQKKNVVGGANFATGKLTEGLQNGNLSGFLQ